MINIFFYNKLKDVELINKISKNYIIKDGYIFVNSYNPLTNSLKLNDEYGNSYEILRGKIVTFHFSLEQFINKLNTISEVYNPTKQKYMMEIIDVTLDDKATTENNYIKIKEKAYIIY